VAAAFILWRRTARRARVDAGRIREAEEELDTWRRRRRRRRSRTVARLMKQRARSSELEL
jgi:hypothetical protein